MPLTMSRMLAATFVRLHAVRHTTGVAQLLTNNVHTQQPPAHECLTNHSRMHVPMPLRLLLSNGDVHIPIPYS